MGVKLIDALLGEHGAFNALFNSIEKLAETGGELAQIETAMAALAAELMLDNYSQLGDRKQLVRVVKKLRNLDVGSEPELKKRLKTVLKR